MANGILIQWVPQGGKRVTLLLARKGGDHPTKTTAEFSFEFEGVVNYE
jgi:hypothetical protein